MGISSEKFSLYNGQLELEFEPGRHIYVANGEKVESITGVLRVVNKPALMFWAVNMACELLAKELTPGVSLDEIQIDDLLKRAKSAHRTKSGEAATIGNFVHDWISKHLKGEKPTLPTNAQIRKGVEAWLKFEKEHKIKITESERKVFSRKHKVAGTCDAFGEYNGENATFDIKTGSGIYAESLLQNGGYDICINEELGIEFKKHIVVNCSVHGDLKIHISDGVERNRQGFIAALNLFRSLEGVNGELKK